MYFTNIANEELEYFHGLKVPNFTIKLTDVLHQTSNVFDNKLFKVEEIISDKLYRIYPLFYTNKIYSSNSDDKIIDDKVIIANKTTDNTYLTFISNEDEPVQDYISYGTYYSIGEDLTDEEFNSIITLLRHNMIHKDNIHLNNEVIQGKYGVYDISINNSGLYMDNGIEATNLLEVTCTLRKPVFEDSEYTLKLKAYHISDVNITGEVSDDNITVLDLDTVLVRGETVSVDLTGLVHGDIIGYDAVVEVNHDNPVIRLFEDKCTSIISGNWLNYSNRATVSADKNGTSIINTASSNAYYFVKNSAYIFEDYECTFDIVSTGNYGLVRWYIQAEDTSNQVVFIFNSYVNRPCTMRITSKDGEVNVYVDDELKTSTPITITVTGPYEIGFRFNSIMTEGTNFIYKNFKIWSI